MRMRMRERGTFARRGLSALRSHCFLWSPRAAVLDRNLALCMKAGFEPGVRHGAGQFVVGPAAVGRGLGVAKVRLLPALQASR